MSVKSEAAKRPDDNSHSRKYKGHDVSTRYDKSLSIILLFIDGRLYTTGPNFKNDKEAFDYAEEIIDIMDRGTSESGFGDLYQGDKPKEDPNKPSQRVKDAAKQVNEILEKEVPGFHFRVSWSPLSKNVFLVLTGDHRDMKPDKLKKCQQLEKFIREKGGRFFVPQFFVEYAIDSHGANTVTLAKETPNLKIPNKSNLGVPRRNMPQIKRKHLDKFTDWLESEGVEVKEVQIPLKDLKPTQKDFNTQRIHLMMNEDSHKLTKPLLISKDKFILDGHHKWLAQLNIDDTKKAKCIQVDLNAKDFLDKAKEFSKVRYRDLDDNEYKDTDPNLSCAESEDEEDMDFTLSQKVDRKNDHNDSGYYDARNGQYIVINSSKLKWVKDGINANRKGQSAYLYTKNGTYQYDVWEERAGDIRANLSQIGTGYQRPPFNSEVNPRTIEEAKNLCQNSADRMIKKHGPADAEATAKLIKKYNKNTDRQEWALVSKSDNSKILEWYGVQKPSEELVEKSEKRVQYFKHANAAVFIQKGLATAGLNGVVTIRRVGPERLYCIRDTGDKNPSTENFIYCLKDQSKGKEMLGRNVLYEINENDEAVDIKELAVAGSGFVVETESGKYLKSYSGNKRIKIETTDNKEDAMKFPLAVNAENEMKSIGLKGAVVQATAVTTDEEIELSPCDESAASLKDDAIAEEINEMYDLHFDGNEFTILKDMGQFNKKGDVLTVMHPEGTLVHMDGYIRCGSSNPEILGGDDIWNLDWFHEGLSRKAITSGDKNTDQQILEAFERIIEIENDDNEEYDDTAESAKFGDVKGQEPAEKDIQRMKDLQVKAKGDEAKMLKLAQNMANTLGVSPDSVDKAIRRAKAAEKVYPGALGKKIAKIFMDVITAPVEDDTAASTATTSLTKEQLMAGIKKFQDITGESWIHHFMQATYGGDPRMPFEWSDIKQYCNLSDSDMKKYVDVFQKHGLMPKDVEWSIEGTEEQDIAVRDMWLDMVNDVSKKLDKLMPFSAAHEENMGDSILDVLGEILAEEDEDDEDEDDAEAATAGKMKELYFEQQEKFEKEIVTTNAGTTLVHTFDELEGFEDYYAVEVEATIEVDNDYGADADGNRGRSIWWVDDYKVNSITGSDEITYYDFKTEPAKSIMGDLEAAIEKAVDKFDWKGIATSSFNYKTAVASLLKDTHNVIFVEAAQEDWKL